MVCLGNICRSPMAEGIMQTRIDEKKLDWEVDSCGTSNWHAGERPDRRATACAKIHDVNISKQVSRAFRSVDFADFDYIFTMDEQNYKDVVAQAISDEEKQKVHLILNQAHPEENRSVPDPYWDDNGFELVFEMLSEACDAFIKKHTNG